MTANRSTRLMRLGGALLVLALAGCQAPNVLRHPDKSEAQSQQDELECDLRATEATAAIRSGLEAGFQKAEIRRKCMMARGYRYVPR